MNDSTPLGLRLQRALKVLFRHQIREVRQLTLPNGQWLPFSDLKVPATEQGWGSDDYHAVCSAMDKEHSQAERHQMHDSCHWGQQQLRPVPIPRHVSHFSTAACPLSTVHQVVADPMLRVVGVSDPREKGLSLLCHFRAPTHTHGHWFPEQWEDDRALGVYLCQAATVISMRATTEEPTRSWECMEVFTDHDQQVHM